MKRLTLVAVLALGGVIACAALPSCSGAQRAAELQALESCGRNDAPGLLTSFGSAAAQATSVNDFGSRLESSTLGTLTSDVLSCLADLWLASQTAPAAATNGATTAAAPPSAVALVKQWRATYDTPSKIDAWRAKVRSGQR